MGGYPQLRAYAWEGQNLQQKLVCKNLGLKKENLRLDRTLLEVGTERGPICNQDPGLLKL